MKLLSFRPRLLLIDCALILAAHGILLLIMARTGIIEKFMTGIAQTGELALIGLFVLSRLAAFLLVPAVIAALSVHWLAQWLTSPKKKAA